MKKLILIAAGALLLTTSATVYDSGENNNGAIAAEISQPVQAAKDAMLYGLNGNVKQLKQEWTAVGENDVMAVLLWGFSADGKLNMLKDYGEPVHFDKDGKGDMLGYKIERKNGAISKISYLVPDYDDFEASDAYKLDGKGRIATQHTDGAFSTFDIVYKYAADGSLAQTVQTAYGEGMNSKQTRTYKSVSKDSHGNTTAYKVHEVYLEWEDGESEISSEPYEADYTIKQEITYY